MGKWDELREKEKKLSAKASILNKKERELSYREKSLAEREIGIARKEKELEFLRQLKEETARLIGEKNLRINDLKSLINQHNRILQDLRIKEQQLLKEQAVNSETKRNTEIKLREINRKERDIARKELDWLNHMKLMDNSREMLTAERESLGQEVKAKKAELYLIKEEWLKKRKGLGEEVDELRKEMKSLKNFVEADVRILEEKEDEIAGLFRDIEKDRLRISKEEKAVYEKIRKLERLQKDTGIKEQKLAKKEKQLIPRERIVAKAMKYINKEKARLEEAKELRKQLPAMKRLQKNLEKFVEEGKKDAIETARKRSEFRRLKDLQKDLQQREKALYRDAQSLRERERQAEGIEKKESEAFSRYVHEEIEKSRGEPSRDESTYPEIHSLKDRIHKLMESGDTDGAIRLIAQLEVLISKVKDPEEKRMMIYDLKELKANIKLTMLV